MELLQVGALSAASVAAIIDVQSRRIPNWLTLSALIAGVLLNGWLAGGSGVTVALAGAVVGGALLLPFYAMRAMGAGDVKLLAAVGALLGPQQLISVAVYGALVGGAMSLLILLARGRLLVAMSEVLVQHRPPTPSGATAPYGVAIASGVYLSLILPAVLR